LDDNGITITDAEQTADSRAAGSQADAPRRGAMRTLVKENIRRYWPIGLVSLLSNIIFGIIPTVIAKQYYRAEDGFFVTMDVFATSWFTIVGIVAAIVSAVAVFRYLHSPARLAVMHAFPVSKGMHFVSNFVSGLLISLSPFIVSALVVLAVLFDIDGAGAMVGKWMLAVCVIILFTYAVSVLAGIVSGNMSAHIIAALFLNFVWAVIYSLAVQYIQSGLFGVDFGDKSFDPMHYLHPFIYFGRARLVVGDFSGSVAYPLATGLIAYLLISLGISALAYFLYRALRAERSGMSLTFRAVEHIFVFACAFGGMIVGGIAIGAINGMYVLFETDPLTYVSPYSILGSALGAVIAFIVAMMIVRSSARVFSLVAFRRFAIFAVAAAIFMVCTQTNITGVETRVPDAAEMKSGAIKVESGILPPYRNGLNYELWQEYYIPISGDSDMDALAQLHKEALKDKAYMVSVVASGEDDFSTEYTSDVKFAYGLKNGTRELRSYSLRESYLLGSNAYARLMSSESVKRYFSVKNLLGYESLELSEIGASGSVDQPVGNLLGYVTPDTDVRGKLTPEATRELAACMDEDYMAMSADDMKNAGEDLFVLKLKSTRPKGKYYRYVNHALSEKGTSIRYFIKKEKISDPNQKEPSFSVPYHVTAKSVKTIAWLKEHGIYDSIAKSAAELKAKDGSKFED
jgi:ABC-2 type transport system permease protein